MRFGKGSSKSEENSELSSSSFVGVLGDVGAIVGSAVVDGAAFDDAIVDGIGVGKSRFTCDITKNGGGGEMRLSATRKA